MNRPSTHSSLQNLQEDDNSSSTSIRLIRNSIYGDDGCVPTPLGARKLTYADCTASGRSSKLIERSLAELVLPLSANTHTSTSYAGYSSHAFLDEARSVLRDAVGASATEDAVIFCGRGATAASNLLVHLLLSNSFARNKGSLSNRHLRRRRLASTPSTRTLSNSKKRREHQCCSFPGCGRILTNNDETIGEGGDDTETIMNLKNLVLHCRTHGDGEATAHVALANLDKAKERKKMKDEENRKGIDERECVLEKDTTTSSAMEDHEDREEEGEEEEEEEEEEEDYNDVDNVHVIVGPYAHNSSYLPWKEAGAIVSHISPSTSSSSIGVDVLALIAALSNAQLSSPRQIICVLTTASNVTGALCGTTRQRCALTALVHAYNGIVVWDCAATASHSPPEMNPSSLAVMTWEEIISTLGVSNIQERESMLTQPSSSSLHHMSSRNDAIFFSMHKFVGGGGGGLPGVLVIKRALLTNASPNLPGGGTVFFVSGKGEAIYTGVDEEREEGGTPDVAGCARASLCMMMCRSVGWSTIQEREAAIAYVARREWSLEPGIIVVGLNDVHGRFGGQDDFLNRCKEAVPIVSLFFKHQPQKLSSSSLEKKGDGLVDQGFALHWGFVSAVLNDFFGIQCRGGCLCAGVFAQSLLGISHNESDELEAALLSSSKNELLRPGFVRISFSFYMSQAEVRYIIDAVKWVARNGHKILHLYTPQPGSGEWRVRRSTVSAALKRGRSKYLEEEEEEGGEGGEEQEDDEVRAEKTRKTTKERKEDPRKVINECTEGETNSGIFDAGQRGDTRSHPRTWLSSVSFFNSNNNNSVHSSKNSNRDGFVTSTDDTNTRSVVKIVCTEERMADLYKAYLKEADLVVLGCHPSSSSSSSFSPTSAFADTTAASDADDEISRVIEPDARHLRWFAVASDNSGRQDVESNMQHRVENVHNDDQEEEEEEGEEKRLTGRKKRCPWPLAERVEALSVLPLRLRSLINDDSRKTANQTLLEKILSTPFSMLTLSDRQVWNGRGGSLLKEGAQENEIEFGNDPQSQSRGYSAAAESKLTRNSTIQEATSNSKDANKIHQKSRNQEDLFTKGAKFSTQQQLVHINLPSGVQPFDNSSQSLSSEIPTQESKNDSRSSSSSHSIRSSTIRRPGLLSGSSSLSYRRSDEFAKTQQALKSIVGVNNVPAAISRSLSHGLREAITEFGMIRDGDRILVGLSGGKDSMTLLLQLLRLQASAPVSFAIGAATVDPQSEGYNPRPLISWCESLGVPYFFESQPIIDLAGKHMGKDSICAFCSRLKRGVLYTACRREGYNVLALGQHLDDFAESFVMSAFRNGIMRTMKACYNVDKGDLRVIRPLVFVRENVTRAYASSIRLPIIPENCPACFTGPTERYKVKRLLATEAVGNPNLFNCLMRAMRPLMTSAGSRAVREGRGGEGGGDDEGEDV